MSVAVGSVGLAEIKGITHFPILSHFFHLVDCAFFGFAVESAALSHVHAWVARIEGDSPFIVFAARFFYKHGLAPLFFILFTGFFYVPDVAPEIHGTRVDALAFAAFTVGGEEQQIVFFACNHRGPVIFLGVGRFEIFNHKPGTIRSPLKG